MFCVLAEADRRMSNDDVATALELIGLVQRQPALTNDNKSEIERILGRSGLPTDVIAKGTAQRLDEDLSAVIDRLLQDLADAHDAP